MKLDQFEKLSTDEKLNEIYSSLKRDTFKNLRMAYGSKFKFEITNENNVPKRIVIAPYAKSLSNVDAILSADELLGSVMDGVYASFTHPDMSISKFNDLIKNQPIKIIKANVISNNNLTFYRCWEIYNKRTNEFKSLDLLTFFSVYQVLTDRIDINIEKEPIVLDKHSSFVFTIGPKEVIHVTFTYEQILTDHSET